jgi:mono/diheme cytochrome c family protein
MTRSRIFSASVAAHLLRVLHDLRGSKLFSDPTKFPMIPQRLLLTSLLVIGFAGCEALKSGAPSINPEMVRTAAAHGDSPETLAAGRRLLAMRCTSCHALAPIAKFSSAEWSAKVHRMAGRAGLNEVEARQVTSYLTAARESL